jgi:hypothetical protein
MKTVPTKPEELREIARGNIERNAEWPEDASADTIYDECYTLAFDALHDAGVDNDTARQVATMIAMEHAQP